MKTNGWFSVHREIFKKMERQSSDEFKFWIWVLSQAEYEGPNAGALITTMSDMRLAMRRWTGRGFKLANRHAITKYIKHLVDDQRVSWYILQKGGQAIHNIKVLNYTEYQGAKREGVTVPPTDGSATSGSTPIIRNKKNKTAAGPGEEKSVRVTIPKELVDTYEDNDVPEKYYNWFLKKTQRDYGFTKQLAEKFVQPQYNHFVTDALAAGRKWKDWYRAWQKWVENYKNYGIADKDRAESEKNFNYAWEQSHGGGKFDGSGLPPEIKPPDHFRANG